MAGRAKQKEIAPVKDEVGGERMHRANTLHPRFIGNIANFCGTGVTGTLRAMGRSTFDQNSGAMDQPEKLLNR